MLRVSARIDSARPAGFSSARFSNFSGEAEPVRVVRQLTAKDREWIEYAWTVYVKRAAEYLVERSG